MSIAKSTCVWYASPKLHECFVEKKKTAGRNVNGKEGST
jgi:hypothetical protein